MRRILLTCALATPATAWAQTAPAPSPTAGHTDDDPSTDARRRRAPPPRPPRPRPRPPPADTKVAAGRPTDATAATAPAPAAPAPAAAADASATATVSTAKPAVEVHGFASIAFSHDFDQGPDHSNVLRTFDTNSDTASIDVVELAVLRSVSKAQDLGFRADVIAGSTVPRVEAASGLFREFRSSGQDGSSICSRRTRRTSRPTPSPSTSASSSRRSATR